MTSTETSTTAANAHPAHSYGKVIGFSALSLVLLGVVFVLCAAVDAMPPPWVINVAIALFGICMGWLAGAAISPYDKEADQFSKIIKVISTFLSGFALGKFSDWLSPDKISTFLTIEIILRGMILLLAF
jgi:hypothetical protein